MSLFGTNIKEPIETESTVAQKEIYWPNEDGHNGNNNFPTLAAIRARNSSSNPRELDLFKEAVLLSQDKLFIIDRFFFKPESGSIQNRIEKILNWFPYDGIELREIKILTSGLGSIEENDISEKFLEHFDIINSSSKRKHNHCSFEVRFHLDRTFNFIHDRFAIIDDELWHFGAAVGGLHSKISAVSRGWRASDYGAVKFFKLAWDSV